jgi:hypothetical protein
MAQVLLIPNTGLSPLPLVGEGAPQGRERVLLLGKAPLSLTLSHQWEREQTQVCSVLFSGAKISSATRVHVSLPPVGEGDYLHAQAVLSP